MSLVMIEQLIADMAEVKAQLAELIQDKRKKEAEEERKKNAPTLVDEGDNQFWKNSRGQYHRDGDLPAIIYQTGDQEKKWYQNGKLHRDAVDQDGNVLPAIESQCGYRAWYQHGKRHRQDGPAVFQPNGEHQWWVDGICVKKLVLTTV